MHVKVKDTVVVLSGKDKGKRGQVLSVDSEKSRVLVERVHVVKKHSRANPRKGVQGGILEKESPIHSSNVMLVCPQCSAPTRAKSELQGKKHVRACRECDARIDR
jgi:large subunit ribosomal protein L24